MNFSFNTKLFIFIIILSGVFFGCNFGNILPVQPQSNQSDYILVKKVIDGDTIELSSGEKVRYIGINTPETVDPEKSVECFGKEASDKNKELVEGKMVKLERDISDKDKYDRLLRYVYLEDGTMVNLVLVDDGYAFQSTFPPDVKYQSQFAEAQKEAKEELKGLWSPDKCSGELKPL